MDLPALLVVSAAAFVLNLGAGRLRAAAPKFSLRWFLYIHLPIVAVIPLRYWLSLGAWVIPWLIAVSVGGQIVGGRTHRNS